jgi:hypothetical protein
MNFIRLEANGASKPCNPITWTLAYLLFVVIGADVVNEVGAVVGVEVSFWVVFPEVPSNPLKCFSFQINFHYNFLFLKNLF